jgi:hypothetical protein
VVELSLAKLRKNLRSMRLREEQTDKGHDLSRATRNRHV